MADICPGCYRSTKDRIDWLGASDEEKILILNNCKERREMAQELVEALAELKKKIENVNTKNAELEAENLTLVHTMSDYEKMVDIAITEATSSHKRMIMALEAAKKYHIRHRLGR